MKLAWPCESHPARGTPVYPHPPGWSRVKHRLTTRTTGHDLGGLAQRLPALTPVDKHTWRGICKLARASWCSACMRCLPLIIDPILCPASWYSVYRRCLSLKTRPSCVSARILGRACSPPTDVASCRQPALYAYLHKYQGELAQPKRRCLLSPTGP